MRRISRQEIVETLAGLGVRSGDVIMVHSDLSRLGPLDGANGRDELAAGYFDALMESMGGCGTVVALTCTESYAREGKPFDYDESPSEQGILSEYLRTRPGAVRSFHPLFSLAAVGPEATALCGDASRSAFGWDSPFGRLHRRDALIVCLGVDLRAMTFMHHVEQMFGVPYSYTKEWSAPVLKSGEASDNHFFAFVRYREAGVAYDFSRFQDLLLERRIAARRPLGYGHVHSARAAGVFAAGMEVLKKDTFALLAHPPGRQAWRVVDEALENYKP